MGFGILPPKFVKNLSTEHPPPLVRNSSSSSHLHRFFFPDDMSRRSELKESGNRGFIIRTSSYQMAQERTMVSKWLGRAKDCCPLQSPRYERHPSICGHILPIITSLSMYNESNSFIKVEQLHNTSFADDLHLV